jgi:hypothetical protein
MYPFLPNLPKENNLKFPWPPIRDSQDFAIPVFRHPGVWKQINNVVLAGKLEQLLRAHPSQPRSKAPGRRPVP